MLTAMAEDFALEPLTGLVDPGTPTIHHVQKVTASAGMLVITTSPEQWAYAVSFDIHRGPQRNALSFTVRNPKHVERPVLIRVTGWVGSGRVGIGLVSRNGGALLAEAYRTSADGLTEVDLWTDSIADCAAVVIRNAGDGASTITVESIRGYRYLGRSRPVTARWIEHRQATVQVRDDDLPVPEDARSEPDAPSPRVSIVLTVKNGMPYLPEAIESLRCQTYDNFELIVQDGASTDGTVEYLRGISDFPVTIASAPDAGIGEARSRAYARCRTDLVSSIDADNVLAPEALSTAVSTFRQHPEAAVVYGAVEMINDDGSFHSSFAPPEFDLLKVITCELVPPWSTAFFSRRVCGAHFFHDPSIPGCVDYDTWLRLGHLPILQITDVLGRTRLGKQSVSCRVENYEVFCEEKIRSLRQYLQRTDAGALHVGLLRHGITGIYCWAAESLERLGASRGDVDRYVDLALRTDPTSVRALRLRAQPERR
jgi:hypothetical protein